MATFGGGGRSSSSPSSHNTRISSLGSVDVVGMLVPPAVGVFGCHAGGGKSSGGVGSSINGIDRPGPGAIFLLLFLLGFLVFRPHSLGVRVTAEWIVEAFCLTSHLELVVSCELARLVREWGV